jgi:hypothetical protein
MKKLLITKTIAFIILLGFIYCLSSCSTQQQHHRPCKPLNKALF